MQLSLIYIRYLGEDVEFYESYIILHTEPWFLTFFLSPSSDDELVSSNVKEKEAKLQFLEKLICFLELNLEVSLGVKPAKIISGLQPERTRYLLQVFTVVATTKCLSPKENKDGDVVPKTEGPSDTHNVGLEESLCGDENEKENATPTKEMSRISIGDIVAAGPAALCLMKDQELPTVRGKKLIMQNGVCSKGHQIIIPQRDLKLPETTGQPKAKKSSGPQQLCHQEKRTTT